MSVWWKLVWLAGNQVRGENIAFHSQWDGSRGFHWGCWSRGGTQAGSQLREAEAAGLDSREELADEDGVKE